MFDEAGEHLHQSLLEGPLRWRNTVPRRHGIGVRGQLCFWRDPAKLFLPRKHALPISVPAIIELTLVLVGPFFEDLMRSMAGARRPVHQERLVWSKRLMPL
jgi:hypothetical protein